MEWAKVVKILGYALLFKIIFFALFAIFYTIMDIYHDSQTKVIYTQIENVPVINNTITIIDNTSEVLKKTVDNCIKISWGSNTYYDCPMLGNKTVKKGG